MSHAATNLDQTILNKVTRVDASAPYYSGEGKMIFPGEIRDVKIPFGSTSTLKGFTFEIVDQTRCDDLVAVSTGVVRSTQPVSLCLSTITVHVNNQFLTKSAHQYRGIVKINIERTVNKQGTRFTFPSLERVEGRLQYSIRKDYGELEFTLNPLVCRKQLKYRVRIEGFTN